MRYGSTEEQRKFSKIGYIDAPVPPVPDAPEAAPAAALPDGGGAAGPLPVEDIPGPAPPPSQSEVHFALAMAHSLVLTASRRPRSDMTRIQVSNT